MPTVQGVTRFFATLQLAGTRPPQGIDSNVAAALWAEALPEVSDAQLRSLALVWLRGERAHQWPTPRDVLEALQRADTDNRRMMPEDLWARMLEAVGRYGYYALTQGHRPVPPMSQDAAQQEHAMAALRSVGGWTALCQAEAAEMQHLRRTWLAAYAQQERRAADQATGALYDQSVQRIEERNAQRLGVDLGRLTEKMRMPEAQPLASQAPPGHHDAGDRDDE
jgi:hypothetical protein